MDAGRVLQLAWTQIWQIAAVTLVAAAAVRLFCRQRPHFAYALWLVVLLKCMVPPLFSSPTGVFSWAAPRHAAAAAESNAAHNFEPEPATPAATTENIDRNAVIARLAQSQLARLRKPADSPSGVIAPKAVDQRQATQPIAASASAPVSLPLSELVLVAWIAGSVVSGCWLAVRLLRLRRNLRVSAASAPPQLDLLLDELRQVLAVRQKVRLVVTSQPFGPALVGTWRPRIVVPAALLNEMTPDELRPILAHELIHLRRGDHWIALVQCAANIVWWFHPAVWFTNHQLVCQREICCDEEVVAGLNCDPAIYATMLLDVLRLRRRTNVGFMPAINALVATSARLAHIMCDSARFRRRAPKSSWLILAIASAIVLPGAGMLVQSRQGLAQRPQNLPPLPHLVPTAGPNNVAPLPPLPGISDFDVKPRSQDSSQPAVASRGAVSASPPALQPRPGPKRTGYWFDWTWHVGTWNVRGETCRFVGGENGRSTIKATVIDHVTGKPLAGAKVRVVCSTKLAPHALQTILDAPSKPNSPDGRDTTYTTDAQGEFDFLLTPDAPHAPMPNLGAIISCPGYATRKFPVRNLWDISRSRAAGEPAFFPRAELVPTDEIHGSIVDPRGKPVAGAPVSASFYEDDSEEYKESAVSDAQGRFKVAVAKESGASITITSPDPNWIDIEASADRQHRDLGTLRFERGHRVTIEADDFYGHPMPGVSLFSESEVTHRGDLVDGTTGRDGRYTTRALPAGQYVFGAFDGDGTIHAAFEWAVANVARDGDPKLVRIHETAHATIGIRVVDSAGRPLDSAVFWLNERGMGGFGLVTPRKPGKIEVNVPLKWRDVGPFAELFPTADAYTSPYAASPAGAAPAPRYSYDNMESAGEVNLIVTNGPDYVFAFRHGDHGEKIPSAFNGPLGVEIAASKGATDLIAIGYRTAPLTVVAHDQSGKPIANVIAYIGYANIPRANFVPVNSYAGYEEGFHRPRGMPDRLVNTQIIPGEPFVLTVSAPGFEPKSQKLTLVESEAKQIDFTLVRAGKRAVAQPQAKPLPAR